MKNKYNVLIIGAGKIAAEFDNPDTKEILTHAHAFKTHSGFNLIGFVDIDYKKAKDASQTWGGKAFKSINDVIKEKIPVDVVSIAVSDEYHYEVLKEILNLSVKFVFAEKPLTKTLQQAEEIINLYNNKKISLSVNYSRRFVHEFENIRKNIIEGKYGEYITGNGYYGKGILHNGSHMIDFLRYMIGEVKEFQYISSEFDYFEDDPSVSSVLTFKGNRRFYMQHVDCSKYTIFELDFLFEKVRIRIIDLGLKVEIYEVRESKTFSGYKNLVKVNEEVTSMGKALYHGIENIYNHLSYGEKIKCSINDGYKVLKICTELQTKIKNRK